MSNSQNFDVPIPPSLLGCGGCGLHNDVQRRRSLEAHRGLCYDGVTGRRYVRNRHVPRVDCNVMTFSNFSLSIMEQYYHEWKLSAGILDSPYHELTLGLLIPINLVTKNGKRYRPTDLFPTRVLYSSYHD
jgi:hypothetical protein